LGLVTLAVLLFSGYFIVYMLARHNNLLTNAEDMGIMDQAIWNLVNHGQLHQTICNIVGDTNCYTPDGINRFAIHFEPILYPISLLYFLWPDPRTLIIFQTVVVALGAYPAFWLARLRLRNDIAAVAIAWLYLLYPSLQQAITFDFHAVTLTASLLMFTLYFMYTRRTALMFLFALLSMGCKEEVPLLVALLGLWTAIFQRRWKSGLTMTVIAAAWFVIGFKVIIPAFSPSSKPLLIGRYAWLGNGPVEIVRNIVTQPKWFIQNAFFEHSRLMYLRLLFLSAAFLPLLAPWVLVLAAPALAINLLSSNPSMHSGLFQYNAEIIPVLIFASIEGLVLILWVTRQGLSRYSNWIRSRPQTSGGPRFWSMQTMSRFFSTGILTALLCAMLLSSLRFDLTFHGQLPFSNDFVWPKGNERMALAQKFIQMIPPDVSVSAQTKMVPRLSHRERIYMFPYATEKADYVLLDLRGDQYPFLTRGEFIQAVQKLLVSGEFGIKQSENGFLLLQRGLPAPEVMGPPKETGLANDPTARLPLLPENVCSDLYTNPQDVPNPMNVTFSGLGGSITLTGYSLSLQDKSKRPQPGHYNPVDTYVSLTTYWRVDQPITKPLAAAYTIKAADGKEYIAGIDGGIMYLCQQRGKNEHIVVWHTDTFRLQDGPQIPNGLAQLSVSLLPLDQSSSKIKDVPTRLLVNAGKTPNAVVVKQETREVQLMTLDFRR
jgi:uncharacterized membrane protein